MSWSISFVGTPPPAIVQALKAEVSKIAFADSKQEYEKALPHLISMVESNFTKRNDQIVSLSLQASGHTYSENGQPIYGAFSVSLQPTGGLLVTEEPIVG